MGNRLPVRRIQRLQNLLRILDGLVQGQRPFQRRAFDVLHYQVVRTNVVKLADQRMIQRRHCARFLLETLGEFCVGNLDGDDTVQASVAGFVHLAHAASPDRRDDFVRTQPRSRREARTGLPGRTGQ